MVIIKITIRSVKLIYFFFFSFWPNRVACGILVPQPGHELRSSAVIEWTAQELFSLKAQSR